MAKIYNNAEIRDDAKMHDTTSIHDNTKMFDRSQMHDNAAMFGFARMFDDAQMHDYATMRGNARIYDNAQMFDDSAMYEDAEMRDNAVMKNYAKLGGNASIIKDGVLGECQSVGINNTVVVTDLRKDLKESIRCQTGLVPFDGKVIAYKQVNKDMSSSYDRSFKYEVGKVAVAKNVNENNDSCGGGLHFSNAGYWNIAMDVLDSIFLVAEIDLDDVITVQEGKIRCRKAKIIGKYEIKQ